LDKLNEMRLFLSVLLYLSFFSVPAQNSFKDSLKQQLVKDWTRAKAYTHEYLDAMPADKYGFRPVDSIRSFAQQMLHLASANVYFAHIATGVKFPFDAKNIEKSPGASSKDSVVYYVNTSYDVMIDAIKNMDASKLGEIVTQGSPGGNNRSEMRITWFMKAFEHQTHHRGQCTVYIRLQGIRPPAEQLF
jgi:uncharacterized damage-inducible protein DinB